MAIRPDQYAGQLLDTLTQETVLTKFPAIKRQDGVTLIELIAVIVILGVALIGVTTADENSAPRGIPPCRANCTLELNFGLDGGESDREDFDDVDDYHGLDQGYGQADPLQDAEGNEREGYENFRVRVSVRYLDLGGGGAEESLASALNDLTDEQDAKLITVTVSHLERPDGWEFSVYKANF